MTTDEFALVEGYLTASTNAVGLVNVNTASEAVLTCIPGIGVQSAGALVAQRRGNAGRTPSVAWVAEVLDRDAAIRAGPYLTSRSYQYSADIAAVGHEGRGYQRVHYIFDVSGATPRIVHRQDLTQLGWALGREVREEFLRARATGETPFRGTGLFSKVGTR